jgi:hypothetical protein
MPAGRLYIGSSRHERSDMRHGSRALRGLFIASELISFEGRQVK